MRASRTYGFVRGAGDETLVPTATMLPLSLSGFCPSSTVEAPWLQGYRL